MPSTRQPPTSREPRHKYLLCFRQRRPAALTRVVTRLGSTGSSAATDCEVPGALTVLCPLYNSYHSESYLRPSGHPSSPSSHLRREQCSVFDVPHPCKSPLASPIPLPSPSPPGRHTASPECLWARLTNNSPSITSHCKTRGEK